MFSTLLELLGLAALTTAAALIGLMIDGVLASVAGGLIVLGPVLILCGYILGEPPRLSRRKKAG